MTKHANPLNFYKSYATTEASNPIYVLPYTSLANVSHTPAGDTAAEPSGSHAR
jgi:hypothetical protein